MNAEAAKKMLAAVLGFLLIAVPPQCAYGYQASGSDSSSGVGGATETAPMSASALQALVAPIALYPDALVAQILAAATFPDQVAIANYWMGQNKSLTGSALMQAVDKQTWDPSVKALTQFPSVLDNLATNLSWTSSLGEAYHNQSADVMTAIQTLRAQAQAKGNLKSTPQITVIQQSPQTIVIQSANPQVVYVPEYNPAVIYGYPYVVPAYVAPAYTTGDMVAASVLSFGAGIAVGAMMSGGCCGWGYSSWDCGWHGTTAVVYHGGGYYGNSAWHGGYYNDGYHNSYGYDNAYNHSGNNYNNPYNHSGNTYNSYHGGNTYNNNSTNVNHQNAQNYNSDHSSSANSWGQHGPTGGNSTAFSGMSGRSGGGGGSGGWSSRAESGRGWGSMGSSGFGGGRFGGGGGSGGGGFRR